MKCSNYMEQSEKLQMSKFFASRYVASKRCEEHSNRVVLTVKLWQKTRKTTNILCNSKIRCCLEHSMFLKSI